jgi:CRISPR-associated endonuclease Cas1
MSALTPEHPSDVALRGALYALDERQRFAVARWLIHRKLEGQRDTLVHNPALPAALPAIGQLEDALAWFNMPEPTPRLDEMGALRTFEGRAAAAYFGAWVGYRLHWRKRDVNRVPPHWLCIRERGSPLSWSARHAVDPTNAILNYAYGVLEGQCLLALAAEGFDVACGILHADKDRRDSLTYDLMEVYRPAVDALVLAFLSRSAFTNGDFVSASDGQCRLHPQLARTVVAACRLEQAAVGVGARELRTCLTCTVTQ